MRKDIIDLETAKWDFEGSLPLTGTIIDEQRREISSNIEKFNESVKKLKAISIH